MGADAESRVRHIWRFAVKGLGRDVLQSVRLEPDGGLPSDRRYALRFANGMDENGKPGKFKPEKPAWLHKSNFLCAYTANELMGTFDTSYNDATECLTVNKRSKDGLQFCCEGQLSSADGRAEIAGFFTHASGKDVDLVESSAGTHHFGNTAAGFKSHPSGAIIHIVNTETVDALSKAAGVVLNATRFRGNIIIDGVPAWEEFTWVGKTITVGGVTMQVVKRTVRCAATNVDGCNGTGNADLDVPGLLKEHFPQHGPYLGVYARVIKGGTLGVGDRIVVTHTVDMLVLAAHTGIFIAAFVLFVATYLAFTTKITLS